MLRLVAALALFALPMAAWAADYVQAPGSTLTFAGKYQGQTFTGRFPAFTVRMRFDPKRLGDAALDVGIPLAGATAGNPDYDGELRGAAFFDIARFPSAQFLATRFRDLGKGRYAADGRLTLRGVARPVTLVFTWMPGARPSLFGQATVKRLDFGVGNGDWSDTALIPDAIAIATKVVLQPAK